MRPGANRWGRVGVVANPCAGANRGAVSKAVGRLLAGLPREGLSAVDGSFAAAVAESVSVPVETIAAGTGGVRAEALALVTAGVETLAAVGGDGTLADAATAVLASGRAVRILGIGVGSSNVGPLVGASAGDLDRFLGGEVEDVRVHALDVAVGGRFSGYAFHDVVLANSYFGTRGGERVDLDAAAALEGEDRRAEPASVCGRDAWIAKNGVRKLVGADLVGGQILASPLNAVDECRGKGVSGFLCWGPYVGCRAVVAAASAVMVRTRLVLGELVAVEPLRLAHLGLAPGDVVEIGGVDPRAVVVADGNPLAAVGSEIVALRVIEDAIVAVRLAASGASREGCGRGSREGDSA